MNEKIILPLSVTAKLDQTIRTSRALISRAKKFQYQSRKIPPYPTKNRLQKVNPVVWGELFYLRYLSQKLKDNGGILNKTIRRATILKPIEDHWKDLTGLTWVNHTGNRMTDFQKGYLENLNQHKNKERRFTITWRIIQELKEGAAKNHFIIMNTLTVNGEHYEQVFKKGSTAFRDYIRKINKFINQTDQEPGHIYFGVKEIGRFGRGHFHTIHILSSLPHRNSVDINRGKNIPSHRELQWFKKFWQFGFSTPIPVRWGPGDSWARIGWRWPVERKGTKWKPIKAYPIEATAQYLTKYLTKATEIKQGDILCPIKIKRKAGLQLMQELMKRLNLSQLNSLLSLPNSSLIKLRNKPIPKTIMIQEATREILRRASPSTRRALWEELKEQPNLIKRLRTSSIQRKKSNGENSGNAETKNTMITGIYKDIQSIINELETEWTNSKYQQYIPGGDTTNYG